MSGLERIPDSDSDRTVSVLSSKVLTGAGYVKPTNNDDPVAYQ
jgi:hypothetical protein